ncbi:thioredoxin domain-containing protein [Solirubrobacter taibaiensis]|nr:thioredoxin domain-containing protein [Solirubrobacter taibaiensis]
MPNRLALETSPYLLQHADNPVDWYPWGDEAFARARDEDKPLLISIGYAACHWCHVMEHESFEDASVAALMNEHFVCVKVDREERPDVDAIYMDAVQAMTGQGGWPLNAFVTPEGNPFWAGTYFPPQSRQQLPSWRDVLTSLAQAWVDQRDEIVTASRDIVPRLAGAATLEAAPDEFDPAVLDEAVAILGQVFDREFGGWGAAPKFPMTSVIEFLLARGERPMALQTLRRMASGGLYDQIGGGFARYSVDTGWVVPHFEKMLYDNALLARAYLHAWKISDDPLFRRVAEETLDWAVRELRQDEGGFASSLDADSEGVEGKFYVWTPGDVRAALSPDLALAAIAHYGITEEGNFEGRTILTRATGDPAALGEIKAGLLAARSKRVRPALDDKRLTSWNALMIGVLAEAGAAFGRADYLAAAEACASFIEAELRAADGSLLRVFNRGVAKQPGFLDDYAYLLEAYLTLYESTFDEQWFVRAIELAEAILIRFHDPERGGFFSTSAEHTGLIARRKDLEDAPIPAGASAACFGLLRLARLTGEASYENAALSLIALLHPIAPKHPLAFGHLLRAMDFYAAPVREVALAGDAADLAAVVRRGFYPHVVLAGGGGSAVPLLTGREPVDGSPAAYVCQRFTCGLPVTRVEELADLLQ